MDGQSMIIPARYNFLYPASRPPSGPAATRREPALPAPRWQGGTKQVIGSRAGGQHPRRSPPQQPLRYPLLEGIAQIRENVRLAEALPPGPSRRVVVKIRGSVADQAGAAVLFLQAKANPPPP